MAYKLGVSTNYLWMIESGERFPSLKLSIGLAMAAGANPHWVRSLWINEAVARRQLLLNQKGDPI